MDNPWIYRNKSQFQLGEDHGKIISGLYSLDSHRLINVPECIVQHPLTNKVTQVVTQILNDFHVPVYNEKTGKGIVRTIVTRVGTQTGHTRLC